MLPGPDSLEDFGDTAPGHEQSEYIHIYIYTYMFVYVYIYMCIHICLNICIYVCIYIYMTCIALLKTVNGWGQY